MPGRAFEYRYTVPLYDIDGAGILFYGYLFRRTHDAFEAFMRALGYPIDQWIANGEWLLPVVHVEADYRMPMRHGDSLVVSLNILAVRDRSFIVGYRFWNEDGERAVAKTVHACVAADIKEAIPLPPDLRSALMEWLAPDSDDESRSSSHPQPIQAYPSSNGR